MSQLWVKTEREKQIKEQSALDKTESGRKRIQNIDRQINAGVGYEYNKFRKSGTKIQTDDPVAKTIEEDLRTEVTLRRELDAVLRDNELLPREIKMNIDAIVSSDNRRTKIENLLELVNHLINTVHDYCVSGEWKIKKD